MWSAQTDGERLPMAFQFLCPQGHLLEGDESQAGQECKCPYCGVLFVVPAAAEPTTHQSPPRDAPPVVQAGQPQQEAAFPDIRAGIDFGSGDSAESGQGVSFGLPAAQQQDFVHIVCTCGQQLETPREMLGQDAMCPHCGNQFALRFQDSLEYRQQLTEKRERREQKVARAWLNWAIVAAVLVVLGVIVLVTVAVSD